MNRATERKLRLNCERGMTCLRGTKPKVDALEILPFGSNNSDSAQGGWFHGRTPSILTA